MASDVSIELLDATTKFKSSLHTLPSKKKQQVSSSSNQNTPALGPKLMFSHGKTTKHGIYRTSTGSLSIRRKRQGSGGTRQHDIYSAVLEGNVKRLELLLETLKSKGENVEHILNMALDDSDSGYSPLHLASRFNNDGMAMFLIGNGATVNLSTNDGTVPLHVAIRYRSTNVAEILIRNGADLSKSDTNGSTPLHLACKRAETNIVKTILSKDASSVNLSDYRYMSPLHLAALSGNIEIIQLLVTHGADIFATNSRGETPLHLASGENNIQAVNILLNAGHEANKDIHKYVNIKRQDDKSALHLASQMGHLEIMRILNEKGGNAYEDWATTSPLHLASDEGHCAAVRLLLSFGIPVQARDKEGQTALHEAASSGKLDVMKLLISEGAEIDAKDKCNFTPLFRAVVKGQTKAVKLLLSHNASLLIEDDDLKSPIHFAVEQGNLEMLSVLIAYQGTSQIHSKDAENQTALHYAAYYGHLETIFVPAGEEDFVSHGCKSWKIDAQDSSGRMAIHVAAECGNDFCLALLAEDLESHGLMITDQQERTVLHLAVKNQHFDTCETCLTCGVDVNKQDKKGFAAIHYAAELGDTRILRLLLENDADVNLKGNDSSSPLIVAAYNQNAEAMTLLLDDGADMKTCNEDRSTFFDIVLDSHNNGLCKSIATHFRWKEALESSDHYDKYMEKLIQFYPEACEIFLDRFISCSDHHTDDKDLAVTYDYKYLVSDPSTLKFAERKEGQYFGPDVMVHYKHEKLLEHPVTKSLLKFKWKSTGRYIYHSSFFMYLLFISSLTALILLEREREINNFTSNSNSNATKSVTIVVSIFQRASGGKVLKALGYFTVIFCAFQMLKEIFQLIVMKMKYFKDPSNYLEWTTYLTAMVYTSSLVFSQGLTGNNKFNFGITSLFLGWINALLYLKRVSICKLYVVMFFNVCLTLLRVILIFGVVFLAFALTFHQLFIKQSTFQSILKSVVKIAVMVSGELDYENFLTANIGKRDPTSMYGLIPFPTVSYVIVVCFVFFMVIALMNLLIGLAVGDIETVRKSANLTILEEQVDFIQDCEAFMSVYILKKLHKTSMTVYPNRHTRFQWIRNRLFGSSPMDELDASILKHKLSERPQISINEEPRKSGNDKETKQDKINRLEFMLHQQYELLQSLLDKREDDNTFL